jgi:enoyl-CoA hydratase/carnithine racemase
MASDPVASRLDEGILTLTLNRPERRNALSEEMIGALHAAITAAGQDREVRVVIIAAEGHVFSAGHDLKEMTAARGNPDGGAAYYADIMARCSAMMRAIVRCPKIVIARVDGVATAAGCQLVASCDLAVASKRARFCTPGVNIGLFCSTPMVALSRNVHRKHAMEMLLTGEMIGARRACRIGLVNKVAAPEKTSKVAEKMARLVAAKSMATVRTGKEAFYRQAEMDLDAAYDYASAVMVENMLAADAREGIAAFIEKRHPAWRD